MISGVLHEDGLADVADAMRAGRTREQMLAILKDSRIGTYGAVAIVLSIVARWQALGASSPRRESWKSASPRKPSREPRWSRWRGSRDRRATAWATRFPPR